MNILEILAFCLGTVFGGLLLFLFFYLMNKRVDSRLRTKINGIFSEVLDNFTKGKITFDCRLNHVVQFTTDINSEGEVHLLYFIDRHELSIFKGPDCIYTSGSLDSKILDAITRMIWSKFSFRIDDVVQMYSFTYDRQTFSRLSKGEFNNVNTEESEPIKNFNLDEILDKINKVGYDGLDESEKEFLKRYK
jgi:hypothetical protein